MSSASSLRAATLREANRPHLALRLLSRAGSSNPGECFGEFLTFLRTIDRTVPKGLQIHLILDNYATHKHPNVKAWLEKHPRFNLHFTPTSSSWLNMIEGFFAHLTNKAIRRGAFASVPDLEGGPLGAGGRGVVAPPCKPNAAGVARNRRVFVEVGGLIRASGDVREPGTGGVEDPLDGGPQKPDGGLQPERRAHRDSPVQPSAAAIVGQAVVLGERLAQRSAGRARQVDAESPPLVGVPGEDALFDPNLERANDTHAADSRLAGGDPVPGAVDPGKPASQPAGSAATAVNTRSRGAAITTEARTMTGAVSKNVLSTRSKVGTTSSMRRSVPHINVRKVERLIWCIDGTHAL